MTNQLDQHKTSDSIAEDNALTPSNAQAVHKTAVLQRLESLRGTVIIGDILEPLNEEWTGDADHL